MSTIDPEEPQEDFSHRSINKAARAALLIQD